MIRAGLLRHETERNLSAGAGRRADFRRRGSIRTSFDQAVLVKDERFAGRIVRVPQEKFERYTLADGDGEAGGLYIQTLAFQRCKQGRAGLEGEEFRFQAGLLEQAEVPGDADVDMIGCRTAVIDLKRRRSGLRACRVPA